jgi:hypothetical protein
MGMFDYLECQFPLPLSVKVTAGHEFQTKDFACECGHYVLTSSGALLKREDNVTEEVGIEEDFSFHDGSCQLTAVVRHGRVMKIIRAK